MQKLVKYHVFLCAKEAVYIELCTSCHVTRVTQRVGKPGICAR
jgi:hypothetical protein